MAEGNTQRPMIDTIPLGATWSVDLGNTIFNEWDRFPKGVPFTIKFDCSGQHFVCGYVYPDGNYGAIFGFSFSSNQLFFVRNYNGNKIKYKIEPTAY